MFLVYSRVILGYVVSKERKLFDLNVFLAIMNMPMPKMQKDIQVFIGMAQFYQCFIKNFVFIMAPMMKLLCKTKVFEWTVECSEAWEAIKQQYLDALILVAPKWDMEFHIHTYASNLVIGVMLAQNPTKKCDQPIVYTSKFLNNVEKNYTTRCKHDNTNHT